MPNYKSYTHIERLGKADTDGILNNEKVFVTAKVDGTNGCIFYNKGEVQCGSRSRQLSAEKDNAGFYQWVHSDDTEAKLLRKFVELHENLIVYGEWLGQSKFVGTIKTYDKNSLGKFYIFDVYDYDDKRYLADDEWRNLLYAYDLDPWFVALYGELQYPTYEDVVKIADENHYLFPEGSGEIGEGVVIKAPGWKNCFGHECYGKLVVSEYKERRKDNAKAKSIPAPGENEKWIIDTYLTSAELSKNLNKTCVWGEVEEFDNHNGKLIGFFLNLCYNESIMEEAKDWVKKLKNPTINFSILNALAKQKGREYIGL